MPHPIIFNFYFQGSFSRVNSEIPNARIFQHTILELSYEMDSKNMLHTFSQIHLRMIKLLPFELPKSTYLYPNPHRVGLIRILSEN